MSRSGSSDLCLHATCVALAGRGLLICGASGSGKSALALNLMALGASLVSDDRVNVTREQSHLMACAPQSIQGLIEARGVGLLQADASGPAAICAVVNMDEVETDRLPQMRSIEILGLQVPLFHGLNATHFSAALIQYLKRGQRNPDVGI